MPSKDVRLGKLPAKIDPRTLKLARYFTDKLSPVLPAVDYTNGVTAWSMMLNDQLGDCTIAACGHAEQVWSLARRGEWTPPDEAILSKYEAWCGYVNGDPSTDNGGVEIDVLNQWRKSIFWGHPLTMYADPDVRNLEHVCKAIEILGGVYIGVALPVSAQGKSTWDVAPGPEGIPGSWGGHAIFVPKYRTEPDGKLVFTCISWGELIDITEAFWNFNDPTDGAYVDEVHALVAPEFLSLTTGESPEGLDLAAMQADALLVAG